MSIIVINGYSGSGKDEFVKYIKLLSVNSNRKEVINYSTVEDIVKMYKQAIRPMKDRDEKFRILVSKTKEALIEFDDIPLKQVNYFIKYNTNDDSLVFIHCREPEEIQKIKDCHPRAITLFIDSDRVPLLEVEKDKTITDYNYDYIIENNGTKGNLLDEAETFLEFIEARDSEVDNG